MHTRNCILEQISNGLKRLGQLVGVLHGVLDFFPRHAGTLRPDSHVFLRGGQQDSPLICFAEQSSYFMAAVNLRIRLVDLPHSRQHFSGSGFLFLWRKLLNSFHDFPGAIYRNIFPIQRIFQCPGRMIVQLRDPAHGLFTDPYGLGHLLSGVYSGKRVR